MEEEVREPEPKGVQAPDLCVDGVGEVHQRPVVVRATFARLRGNDAVRLKEIRSEGVKLPNIGVVLDERFVVQYKVSPKGRTVSERYGKAYQCQGDELFLTCAAVHERFWENVSNFCEVP